MKKLLLVCLVATLALTNAFGQSALFPTKKGTVAVYNAKDAKGNVLGYSQITITDVEGSGANMTISYTAEALDANRKPYRGVKATPMTLTIKDNKIVFDMKSLFAGADAKAEITGDPIELPNNLSAGQTLKDAKITMTTRVALVKMTTEMAITDYKCLAVETVTVPAGSYKAYKVTQTVSTTAMKQTTKATTITWYAEGVGSVKTESYDGSGNLLSTSELVEFK